MFLRSLQWRLIIIIATITFILMSVIWVFLTYKVEDIFYNDFKGTISRNYATLNINSNMSAEELISKLEDDPVILSQLVSEVKSYTIINADTLEIVYSSDALYGKDKIEFRNEILKSENLMSVINGNAVGERKTVTKSQSGDFYDYVKRQPLLDGDYVLFFKYNRSQAIAIIKEFNNAILIGMILAVAVAVIIGFLLSRTITKPITDITKKAESITSGDFDQVLEVKSDDEIGKLTGTFNYMASQLKSMLSEISNEKNKFEMILNYMTDGIIAFNRNGHIIHINTAAAAFLESEKPDQTFTDITKVLNVPYTLHELLSSKNLSDISCSVQIRNMFLKIQFAAFTDKENNVDGIIMVLQDNTKEYKLNNMRKEFVANVSHELKTPLTSIKSYSETLLDGVIEDTETARNFVRVIYSESNRMDRIVKDLLLLSKHDSGIKLNFQRISPVELIHSVVEQLRLSVREKEQRLNIYSDENISDIYGDRDRLEQLFLNVIGNAIKYTPEHGIITVHVGHQKNGVSVKVIDTGIGIPEKDLERIFERFYRVDKARSRQLGGTGLGLSIAKEIAESHGGTIQAKSKLRKGTEITVFLPVNDKNSM
ncbi:MAG TPA: histidine kinase [Ruminiclostridium sp.]|mgnify:FL=1|jgi:two-component system sensor histidine kinase VicK|nr:cell wall metabolism sensor histidine kinase WalK [Clostridiaceae bacterium]HAA25438.1 histidine kinase [Ruminiclostridium sp.]